MQQAAAREHTTARHLLRAPAAEDILRCGIIFIAARASVLGSFPFAVACFAAILDAPAAYLGVIAVGLAVWTAGASPVGYLLACGLFWLYAELRLRVKNPLPSMAVCSLCVFAGGFYGALTGGNAFYALVLLSAESLLGGLSYYVFRRAAALFSPGSRTGQEDFVCGVIMLGVLLMGISGVIVPPGAELSVVAGIFIVLSAALHMDLSAAGCFGLSIGFICSMNRPWAILLAGVFGISTVFASLLKGFGKFGASMGFLLGMTVSLLYLGDFSAMPLSVASLIFGCVLFVLVPDAMHRQIGGRISAVFSGRERDTARRVKRYLSGELKSFAKAFADLADQFLRTPAPDAAAENKTAFLHTVSARVCTGCSREEICWGAEADETEKYAYRIMEGMEKEGVCSPETLPIVFRNRCIRPAEFVSAFNHVYELTRQDTLHRGEASAGQALVARQYDEISNMIQNLSYAVEGGFCFLEDCEQKIADRLAEAGIFVRDVSVAEHSSGGYSVELVPGAAEPMAAEIVSEVLGVPMELNTGDQFWCKLTPACRFTAEIAVRRQTKPGETVCGDTLQFFETGEHRLFVVLCDGMGSGEDAGAESSRTAGLLKEFIENGISKETAVNLINAALALRPGQESFTTVDIAEIDLRTGEADRKSVV